MHDLVPDLALFVSDKFCVSIKELGDLRYLGGELRISWLENVDSVEDVLKANLREKANLNDLSLTWRRDSTGSRREREALDALQPHTNLKKLSIYRYAGSFFPKWVGDASFSNIVLLNLIGCEYCLLLPPVGQLPSLREFCVQGFDGLETVGAEFCGSNSSVIPFQSLEILSFHEMSKWSEWLFIGGDKEVAYFPRLKQLCLFCCSNLTGSLPDCDSIETLRLNWCAKLEFPGSCRYANLRTLEITACDTLTSLPLDYFPMLKELVLCNCQKLESLTFSKGSGTVLHYLRVLRLFNCENFRSLPENMHGLLPSLAFMEMSECPNIESLPEAGLPRDLDTLVIL
ncbi:hypothetical protein L484_016248 [Morus notabilis]|uniref:R13L1/DRL21-like LRR repeat region domain-containing protein n=1 Tax=Morus notabilis TaxID=981085 RepID=W9REP6_9ROSA|nr:hypothetical protein L484_016248 [Morus notabilis]